MSKEYALSDVSFVIPSRNNLKYLKWAYQSIRENIGPDIWICMADDWSDLDQTWEWMQEIVEADPRAKAIKNDTGNRLGHTIMYDKIVEELVETDIFIIAHADMYWLPGSVDNMLKHYKGDKTVVSATRIEPPLHPDGPEKHLFDMGQEPEEFKKEEVLALNEELKASEADKVTEGIFAPWMCSKNEFLSIGGHDPLYAPQSKEDSDIFNRFVLDDVAVLQSRDSFVAHLTCRGSRFNPFNTDIGTASDEWMAQNVRSTRNFIRKWGHFVQHDALMKPIIPHKYDIGFKVKNAKTNILNSIEPWCSNIQVSLQNEFIRQYIDFEQPNTAYDLNERIVDWNEELTNDIIIYIDGYQFNERTFSILQQLPTIIESNKETIVVGQRFALDTLEIEVRNIRHLEKDLIKL